MLADAPPLCIMFMVADASPLRGRPPCIILCHADAPPLKQRHNICGRCTPPQTKAYSLCWPTPLIADAVADADANAVPLRPVPRASRLPVDLPPPSRPVRPPLKAAGRAVSRICHRTRRVRLFPPLCDNDATDSCPPPPVGVRRSSREYRRDDNRTTRAAIVRTAGVVVPSPPASTEKFPHQPAFDILRSCAGRAAIAYCTHVFFEKQG